MANINKKIFYSAICLILVLLAASFYFLIPDWNYLPFKIDPLLLSIGPFKIHWYGLMYVFAFLTSYSLAAYRIKTEKWKITVEQLTDFLNWLIVGVLLGGRLGYVVLYKPVYFFQNPLEIFLPLQRHGQEWFFGIYGMSYHGGLIGVVTVFILFCRKYKINIWDLSDLIVPTIPLGYAFGRLGNFINGELYGRATNMPWGMYFPADEFHKLRHPSQLYEMFMEGILLFVLIWAIRNKPFVKRKMVSVYLIGYGTARFVVEFFREADPHLGYLFGWLTMGQILCGVMIAVGAALLLIKNNLTKNQIIGNI